MGWTSGMPCTSGLASTLVCTTTMTSPASGCDALLSSVHHRCLRAVCCGVLSWARRLQLALEQGTLLPLDALSSRLSRTLKQVHEHWKQECSCLHRQHYTLNNICSGVSYSIREGPDLYIIGCFRTQLNAGPACSISPGKLMFAQFFSAGGG